MTPGAPDRRQRERRREPRSGDDRRRTDKVPCLNCGHGTSSVVDSRGPLRIRICDKCQASFLTTEHADRLLPTGTKRIAIIDLLRVESRNI